MARSQSTDLGGKLLLGIFAVLLIVVAWIYAGVASNVATEQGAVTLRQTVLDSAMQCLALEGAYPPTLEYLEQEYGLVINRDDYVVTYVAYASNVMPSVQVVVR